METKYYKIIKQKKLYCCQLLISSSVEEACTQYPIETGRWKNVTIQNRICPLCNNVDIGDEFHYIFTCTFFKNLRNRFLPSFCQSKPNIYKLLKLFNSKKAAILRRLSIFCSLIMNVFKSSGWYYVVVFLLLFFLLFFFLFKCYCISTILSKIIIWNAHCKYPHMP